MNWISVLNKSPAAARIVLERLGTVDEAQFSDCSYLQVKGAGIEVLVQDGGVSQIAFFIGDHDEYSCVDEKLLPEGLSVAMTYREIVGRFGQPARVRVDPDDPDDPVWVRYEFEDHALRVSFGPAGLDAVHLMANQGSPSH